VPGELVSGVDRLGDLERRFDDLSTRLQKLEVLTTPGAGAYHNVRDQGHLTKTGPQDLHDSRDPMFPAGSAAPAGGAVPSAPVGPHETPSAVATVGGTAAGRVPPTGADNKIETGKVEPAAVDPAVKAKGTVDHR
jgi:hypothetical protein